MTGLTGMVMTLDLEIQRATSVMPLPDDEQFRVWASTALQGRKAAELTVRLVDREESRQLNARFRGKDSATNVLSFPAELPGEVDLPLLGDVVICAPLVNEEAGQQGKTPEAHWAHLTIHGILHLLGFDHQDEQQATEMEALEIRMLAAVKISNPYQ